jgi:hypothetical protein
MLKILFLIFSILLVLFMFVYKKFVCKLKRTSKTSVFVSFLAGILLFYILTTILYAITTKGILNKVILMLLAFSPFIIGKFATYEKEKLYSYLQILIVTFGIFYVLMIL